MTDDQRVEVQEPIEQLALVHTLVKKQECRELQEYQNSRGECIVLKGTDIRGARKSIEKSSLKEEESEMIELTLCQTGTCAVAQVVCNR